MYPKALILIGMLKQNALYKLYLFYKSKQSRIIYKSKQIWLWIDKFIYVI